jgi:drug/metabolite transporter (DMT)-like permease
MERNHLLGIGFGVLAGALWGLVFLAPNLTPDFTAFEISAGRYLAYGAMAVALIAPRWNALKGKLTRDDWLALTWLSLAGNIVYYIFLATAVQLAGPAPAALIVGLLPVAISLIGTRDEGAVSVAKLAPSLVLAVAGVALISMSSLARDGLEGSWQAQAAGLICAVGALACWTLFAVGNARRMARLPHVSSHDWSLLLGVETGAEALLLTPAFLLSPQPHDMDAWLRLVMISWAIALLASIAGNALWNSASRRLPLTMTGQMVIFETLFALFYGFVWEQRLPTVLEALAILALVLAVLWCVSSHRMPRPHE